MRLRLVVDTNVYVSGLIFPASIPRQAISRAWEEGISLISEATWNELLTVLQKPKLTRYVEQAAVQEFLEQAWEVSDLIPIPTPIRVCRDPRDDKFLELAVHGHADLLILHPFQGVQILTPADFLAR
jgi:uncharacterized protein